MEINGRRAAAEIEAEIKEEISHLQGRKPCLTVILVGEDPASKIYVARKRKMCTHVGIQSISRQLPSDASQEELLTIIDTFNRNPDCDGILVQSPLPPQIDEHVIMEAIDPSKDVDGFHPINMGKLLAGRDDGFVPCTPLGIKTLLEKNAIEIMGKHIVIVGRSNTVGKPMAALLIQRGRGCDATVTVIHRKSLRIKEICSSADILISAMGQPEAITADMVKEGAVVVDVGINRIEDDTRSAGYRLVGDVAFDEVRKKCSAITPVPGGVGPMTIAMLMHNTLLAYQRHYVGAAQSIGAY